MCLLDGRKCPSTISESFKNNRLPCFPLQVSDKSLRPHLPLLTPKTAGTKEPHSIPTGCCSHKDLRVHHHPFKSHSMCFPNIVMSLCWDESQVHASSWDLLPFPFRMLFAKSINCNPNQAELNLPWECGGVSSKTKSVNDMFICAVLLDPRAPFNLLEFPLQAPFFPLPAAFPYFSAAMPFPCRLMDPLLKTYKETQFTTVAFRETVNPIIKKVYLLIKVFHVWNTCLLSSF